MKIGVLNHKPSGGNKDIPADKLQLRKRLLTIALPVIAENLLQVVFHFADMIFVGKLGAIALAGIGVSQQFIMLVIAVLISFNIGIVVLISQNIGAKKIEAAQKVAFQALYLGLAVSLVLSTVAILFSYDLPRIFGVSDQLRKISGDYLYYLFAPSIVFVWMFGLTATFRGSGDTRTPLYVAILANGLNIFLDYVLIFGVWGFPRLGVSGAAIATSISRGVGCLLLFIIIFNKKRPFHLPFKLPKVDLSIIRRILSIGIPTAMERLAFSLGGFIYARIVLSISEKAFAAHRIALNVESLSFNPGMGFAVATTALVGMIVGAGDSSKAKRAAVESLKLAATIMGILGIFFFFFPDLLVKLFTSDEEVINQSRDVIKIIALVQPFLATVFVLEGALRGGGDTRTPMYITATGMWLVRLPLAYLFVIRGEMGLIGAWLAMSADIFYKGIMVFTMFMRKKSFKSHVEIEKQEEAILEDTTEIGE